MEASNLIWLDEIVEKLTQKHKVSVTEVEQMFTGEHLIRLWKKAINGARTFTQPPAKPMQVAI